jgi:hypothetical protein
VRSKVFAAVTTVMNFWVKAPCKLVGRKQRFGEAFCFHFQVWIDEPGLKGLYIQWQEGKSEKKGQLGRMKLLYSSRPTFKPWKPKISLPICFPGRQFKFCAKLSAECYPTSVIYSEIADSRAKTVKSVCVNVNFEPASSMWFQWLRSSFKFVVCRRMK